ncbi:MAG: hypothetical protein SCARUB_02121 [Candidatus Scalindua rubra]|uniref:Transposase InsH N-terminal domain-containing protein n=1 Tax=Candidatus Scalindua rubra TaxID=1872076 RepID=A0A1E3XAV8_9BACT|nr:MAG: hypothetical protein SCARUB_02121 [Candidatus Scalindua rubra]
MKLQILILILTPNFKAMLPPIFRHFSYIHSKMVVYTYLSVILSSYLMIFLLFWGRVSIEHIPTLLLNTSNRRQAMDNYQLPLPTFSSAYLDLIDQSNDLVRYFRMINLSNIYPVVNRCYSSSGPKGYGVALFLSRIMKVKQTFVSDRILAKRLSENSTYRHLCLLDKGITPSHNTYNTLRKRLGVDGYAKVHVNFVNEANKAGLLNPYIKRLPKNRRKGLILIGDSTPIRSYCSSKGIKQDDGSWLFTDPSVSFGRPHHRDKYPVGHKAHSLITITGIPMISIVSTRIDSDQIHIFPLLDEFKKRFSSLSIAYIVLDAGYDAEEIHKSIYEDYNIIPIIIRKEMVYPKGFNTEGIPLCDFGYPLMKTGIDYKRKRSRYHCRKICQKDTQMIFPCSLDTGGFNLYTRFKDSYRKYGPATPDTIVYKKLKPFRTAIERGFGLVKENRYRMEYTNTYMGINNVTMHVIEHDILLTQDIIFEYNTIRKISPVIKV